MRCNKHNVPPLLLPLRYRDFTFNPVGYPAAELADYVKR
jgi:hypothetical protein